MRTSAGLRDYIRRTVASYYHPAGTCRMGTGADAVVDPQLRVRGLAGLRVADASVMPSIPNAQPNATVLAIAERAAELISGAGLSARCKRLPTDTPAAFCCRKGMKLWRRPRQPHQQLRRYVETHHIDMIPAGARHGKPWHQFAFWWGGNVNVFNVVLGAVVISIGLAFWWALIAIAAGTLIGALLIALHATQGPMLGVPQTIQSRAQFGFYGSAFLFPAVLLINVGFIAAQFVIQAQAMRGVIGVVTIPQWILILAVPAVVIGIFGYRWIHRVMQATAVVVGVSLVVMLVQGLRYGSLPAHEMSLAQPAGGPVFGRGGVAGDRHAVVRPVRVRLHPLPARRDERAAAVLGDLRRERGRDVLFLRGRRLPRPRCCPRSARWRRSAGCRGRGRWW